MPKRERRRVSYGYNPRRGRGRTTCLQLRSVLRQGRSACICITTSLPGTPIEFLNFLRILFRSFIPKLRRAGRWVRCHFARILRLHLLPYAIACNLKCSALKFIGQSSPINFRDFRRAAAPRRPLSVNRLTKRRWIPSRDVRAFEGHVVLKKSTQFTADRPPESGCPRNYAKFLLLRKLPRKRGILREKRILIPVIPTKKIRVGSKNHSISRMPPCRSERFQSCKSVTTLKNPRGAPTP